MIEVRYDEKWNDFINEEQIREILKVFLNCLFEKEYGISLYITDDNEIQKLNKDFRNKDQPTDILSWSYFDNISEIKEKNSLKIVGELVVSAERVLDQSSENGWDYKTELIRLLAHGCAHIAGWDHDISQKEDCEMLKVEIKLLNEVGIKNIY